jgi:hypothetical protein
MRSIFSFIVKPVGERYNNKVKVEDKELIINTKIESFKSVNNVAEVVAIPLAYSTDIKVGDIVVIHHNVFRVFYDIKEIKKIVDKYFMDDLYFCDLDQIYLYKNTGKWKAFMDRCFIKPIKNKDYLNVAKEQSLLVY